MHASTKEAYEQAVAEALAALLLAAWRREPFEGDRSYRPPENSHQRGTSFPSPAEKQAKKTRAREKTAR